MSDLIYNFETEEELKNMKEKVMKIKVILLDKMGKSPLTNPKYLKGRERQKFLENVKQYLETKKDDEINEEFNEIFLDKLFDSTNDVSTYPVYSLLEKEEEKESEKVEQN